MLTFFQRIEDEMKSVEVVDPGSPVEQDETVFGTVPEDLRRLFCLANQLHSNAHHAVGDFVSAPNQDAEEKARKRAQALHEKANFVREMFWDALKEEFNLLGSDRVVGVREGWKAVSFPPRNVSLSEFFLTSILK
ncbi:MAG TPA: hypothetical protein VJA22_03735 [Patescibacteria group bacterium]|nr:hypothetical protein [Patescibacteria group bacterium]